MLAWGRRHGFLITLAILFAIGFFAAERLRPVAEMTWLRNAIVFAVMWASGVTLPLQSVQQSIRRPASISVAIGLNVVAVPLAAWWIAGWMAPDWRAAFYVASLVPCTLASAMVWTRRAGGDESIPMVTTVVTNLACVAVIPIGWWMVSQSETVAVLSQAAESVVASAPANGAPSIVDQVIKLVGIVVVPLSVAQWMRKRGWAEWADRSKRRLSTAAQGGILVMVMFGAVTSADRLSEITRDGGVAVFVQLIATASVIHLVVLAGAIAVIRWCLQRPRETQIAVGFSASQKTLAIGLQASIDFGVSVLPMIVYHIAQLVWDTVIADAWSKSVDPVSPDETVE
ncbi:bile acid:sodium symporter family protein [Rhodopirellula halodulae]|uniref:bile acid:sodium symporter family protein n=1 Tax=Rhodopirellula halodulae TaxID=2894198 RepID=UPI001E3819E4|nr:bile acid:sodium symporter [Rhodopirellula sp. JC737]MCC9656841.1 bile acid:sodium symporter [Rhodopirellula sp. JC737]